MEKHPHELSPAPSFSVVGKQAWYKISELKTMRCRVYYDKHSEFEPLEPTRTARNTCTSMGSSSKSVKVPADAQARIKKRHRKVVLEITSSLKPVESVFEKLSDLDRALAFAYYYDHPEELPDRETEAMRRASEKPMRIKINFDLDVFEREVCLRPIPAHELEEIDPFTIVTRSSPPSARGMAQAFPNLVIHGRRTPPLDDL